MSVAIPFHFGKPHTLMARWMSRALRLKPLGRSLLLNVIAESAHLVSIGGTGVRFVIFAERETASCVSVSKPEGCRPSSKMECAAIYTVRVRLLSCEGAWE